MRNLVLLVNLMAMPAGAMSIGAEEVLRCETYPDKEGEVSKLVISPDGEEGYEFYASRCLAGICSYFHDEDEYVRSGTLERVFYNGHPTMVFESETVSIRPSFARSFLYRDKELKVTFFFHPLECTVTDRDV